MATAEPQDRAEAQTDQDGRVLIRWTMREWDKSLVGFRLLRRQRTGDSSWTRWESHGPAVIQPDFSEARLKKQGLMKVLAKMPEWRKQGNPTESGAVLKKLASEPKAFAQISLLCAMDPEWALAFGLAWRDELVEKGGTYEYAVAKVLQGAGGRKVQEPFATVVVMACHGGFSGPPIQTLTAHRIRQKQYVVLEWTVASKDIEAARDVRYWSIVGGGPAKPLKAELAKKAVHSRTATNDGNVCTYRQAVKAEDNAKIKYALAPINSFGTVGLLSRRVVVGRRQPDLTKPEAPQCELLDGACIIRWVHHTDARVAGYEILRQISSGKREVVTDSPLPPGRRQWTDKDLAACAGKRVTYYVRAVSDDYRANATSGPGMSVLVPMPKPDAPRDFKAEFTIKAGKRCVACTWTPATDDESIGYIVRKLIPEQKLWVDFGTSKTGRLEKEVGKAAEVLILRVVAVTGGGPRSDPSNQVRVTVPPARPFTASGVKLWVQAMNDGGVHFLWDAPAWEEVVGFRVLVDGNVVADEKALSTYVRQFKCWSVPENAKRYELVLVDKWGRSTEPVKCTTVVRDGKLRDVPKEGGTQAEPAALDPKQAKRAVEIKPRREQKDRIYSRREYLVWPDGQRLWHGTTTYYSKNGAVRNTVEYRMGKLHGLSRTWSSEGKMMRIVFFLDGKLVSREKYLKAEGDSALSAEDKAFLEGGS